jgi:YYY domain-containing protein
MHEYLLAFKFYFFFSLFGVIGFSVLRKTFNSFAATYLLSKLLGLLMFAYPVWLLSSLHLIKYNQPGLLEGLFVLAIGVSLAVIIGQNKSVVGGKDVWGGFRPQLSGEFKKSLKRIFWIEAGSLVLYLFYLWVRHFSAQIEGTEKFMDMSMIMGAGKTEYFPFMDPWQGLKTVNYYYYGFYLYSIIIRLSRVPYSYAYNFSLGLIYTLSFTLSAVIVYRITKSKFFSVFGAGFVTMAGHLHYAVCYLKTAAADLGSKCYWPSGTRLYDPSYTINEFPLYSFLLADLHPHLMSMPFFLGAMLLLWYVYSASEFRWQLMFAILMFFSAAALINTWDFITAGLILGLLLLPKLYLSFKAILPPSAVKDVNERYNAAKRAVFANRYWIVSVAIVAASPFLMFWPFFAHFKSPITGIGFSPEYASANNIIGKAQYPSTPWFLFSIWGIPAILVLSGGLITHRLQTRFAKRQGVGKANANSDASVLASLRFPLLLFAVSFALIAFTELFFFEDIYHITTPLYFRSNTVFKLGFHAWILMGLALASVLSIVWKALSGLKKSGLKNGLQAGFAVIMILFAGIICIYPVEAVRQAYNPFLPAASRWNDITLDGSEFILKKSPDDYAAIQWINENIKDRSIILEAPGSSYTYFGRIGVFTGMANPINWEAHQWGHRFHLPPGIRNWKDALGKQIDTGYGDIGAIVADAKRMYETNDPAELRRLVDAYKVQYIYVGDLERTTYPNLEDAKFGAVGDAVFISGNSKLYKMR